MDTTSKNRWQVRGAALLVFVLGFAAGALVFTAYQRWSRNQDRVDHFSQMIDSLGLTADQKTQVHQILSDTRQQLKTVRTEIQPRFDDIRKQADERLQKVMTPEQWQTFQQKRAELRSRGGRRRGGPDGKR
jgi:Spy/CpxP family protein refolding chaperone